MVTRPSVMAAEHLFCVPQPKPLLKPVPVAAGARLIEFTGVERQPVLVSRPAIVRAFAPEPPRVIAITEKACVRCTSMFRPTGARAKYCLPCRRIVDAAIQTEYGKKYRAMKRAERPAAQMPATLPHDHPRWIAWHESVLAGKVRERGLRLDVEGM